MATRTISLRVVSVPLAVALALVACVQQPPSPAPPPSATPAGAATVTQEPSPTVPPYPPPTLTAPPPPTVTPPPTPSPVTPTPTPFAFSEPVTYTDPLLGISFQYPLAFGTVVTYTWPGNTGEKYVITFSGYNGMSMGGVTSDYGADHGPGSWSIYGYYESNGRYYLTRWNNEIVPIRTIEVSGAISGTTILVADFNSLVPHDIFIGKNQLGAFVNLPGEQFPGLAIYDYDIHRVPPEVFYAILETLTVRLPKQPH